MRLELGTLKFRIAAISASLILLAGIVLATTLLFVNDISAIERSYVVNFTADIFCMCLGYILYICCVMDRQWNGSNLNHFLMMIFTAFTGAFTDELAWLVDGKPQYVFWNAVVNSFYYATAPILAYLFWCYVCSFLNIKGREIKLCDRIYRIGLILSLLLIAVNLKTKFYFYIGEDGVYHRSAYYPVSLIYTYLVLILTMVLIVHQRKRFKPHQVISLFIYALAPLVVGVFSALVYGLSVSYPVIMLILLLMYCVLNVVQGKEKSVAESELKMANTIQVSMLPRKFPPYPEKKEFDLYASMIPAREVGGDFYDFFMPDDDHLVMVIADVSGKGVPAALYMMVSKSMIKNQALSTPESTSNILSKVNDQICENNTLDLFVTCWIGVLTLSTGKLMYSNAGHDDPVLKNSTGRFNLIRERHSPPLGAMGGIKYREETIDIKPEDIIFLYTDGVIEATDREKVQFGADNMVKALNEAGTSDPEGLDKYLKEKIDAFTDGAPQFDDLTMLIMKYNGSNKEDRS